MVYFDSGLGDDKPKSPASSITVISIAVICGVLSVITYVAGISAAAAVFGAIGLVVGGFSFGRAFTAPGKMRNILTGLVAVALILSVVGFMLGFSGILG